MAKIDDIQKEAHWHWDTARRRSNTLEMCTGSGKSKVAIDIVTNELLFGKYSEFKVLLLVPTRKLRDNNWREEFNKWGHKDFYYKHVQTECYATAYKFKDHYYDFVIADEIHNSLSENYSEFYKNNGFRFLLGLSATVDYDDVRPIAPVCFTYTLDQGIEDGVISPYRLHILEHKLEERIANIRAGSKSYGFWMQTEVGAYKYKTKRISRSGNKKFARLDRMRFLWTLKSKIDPCKKILKKLKEEGKRVVLFSGSKDMIDLLTPHGMHSGKTDKENDEVYDAFNSKDISIIGSAKKLKEGHNLTEVDAIVIVSYSSSELDFVQRLGRGLRYSPNKQADVYIFKTKGTQEEDWFNKMSKGMDFSHATTVKTANL
jgi:superfamily II DNA or RNA helicase